MHMDSQSWVASESQGTQDRVQVPQHGKSIWYEGFDRQMCEVDLPGVSGEHSQGVLLAGQMELGRVQGLFP